MKIAIVRGKFLNRYEMQFFEPLVENFDITAFGSLKPYHDKFAFPVVKLPSPLDLPDFPYKMPVFNRLLVDAHYLWGLEEKLKGFDIVHSAETYFHYTQQCLDAKKKGYVKKVIATALENIPFNNEGIWGRKKFKKRARVELDHIIALTNLTRKALIAEGTDPGKITVISHFVDTKRFAPSKAALARRNSTSSNITVLFVGRLEAYKGVYEILEAARRLIADAQLKKYSLTFTFAGEGSQKKALESLEKKYGIGRFVSHTQVPYDRMPEVYDSADIFVAPSKAMQTWQEQYCTALLEAQANGLAIVTTRSGGIPENIGAAGILIPPGDPPALAREIKNLIVHPQLRLAYAQKARKRALAVHDSRIGAKKLAQLYYSILPDS